MSWNINELMNGILAFGEILLCYVWLCEVIIEKIYLQIKDKTVIVSTVILLGSLLMLNRKIAFVSYSMLILATLITCISAYAIVKRKLFVISVATFTYYLIVSLINIFLAFISMSFLKERFDTAIYYSASSIWKNSIYLVSLIIIIVLLQWIRKKKVTNEMVDISLYTKTLFLLDLFLYMVWRQYQNTMDMMALGDQEMQGVGTGFSLLSIVLIAGFVGIIFLKYKIIEEDNRNYLLRDEIYKNNFIAIENVLEKNRQMVHDVKNHFMIIREMGEKNDIESLLRYVDNLQDEYCSVKNKVWTGNRIIDLILNQKKAVAEQKGIRVVINVVLLPDIKLNEVELCSIFGNLLDNSIEACEKIEGSERVIDVSIKAQQELLFINITNSTAERAFRKNGSFITSKQDKKTHGYGLKSVERVVNKYEGIISYQVESNKFKVDVTFFDMINNI